MWFSMMSSTSLPVGINYRHAVAGENVFRDHVPHEGTLTGTAHSEQGHVATPRIRVDANRLTLAVRVETLADKDRVKRHGEGMLEL